MNDITKHLIEDEGFIKYNNYKVEEVKTNEVTLSAVLTKDSLNPHGIAHGGFIFGLADTAMGVLAFSSGKKVVTVDSDINYLKPCQGKKITCVATPIKEGKTLGVYEAKIYNDGRDLAVIATGTYLFLDRDIKKK